MPNKLVAPCSRCGAARPHNGRGLCSSCYAQARRGGTLIDHERRRRPPEEVAAEYRHLRGLCGHPKWQVAEMLGLKLRGLRRALQRAAAEEQGERTNVPVTTTTDEVS
jgi:hypothetical protein